MKTNRKPLLYIALLSLLPALVTSAEAAGSARMVQPQPGQSLSDRTRVVVDVSQVKRAERVLVYVDLLSQPVCSITAAPFECEIDAHPMYQGRSIRALVVNRNGRPVGMASVVTLGFPEPLQAATLSATHPAGE